VKILGVDPGLASTGFGCVENRGREYYAVYAATAAPPADLPLHERLASLRQYAVEVLASLAPAGVAVEQLFSHAGHPQTVILMAHARGVVLEACAAAGIPVYEYAARRVKQAVVGAGGASKAQVAAMVTRLLNLKDPPANQHEADAFAVALCAHLTARVPGL
jgi:crossover junction endodeoxyribonuclease RuvC